MQRISFVCKDPTWFNALLPCCSSFHAVLHTVVKFTTLQEKNRQICNRNISLKSDKSPSMHRVSPFWCKTCWAGSLGRCVSTDTAPWSWDSRSCWWASRTTSARKRCRCCCAGRCSRRRPEGRTQNGNMIAPAAPSSNKKKGVLRWFTPP